MSSMRVYVVYVIVVSVIYMIQGSMDRKLFLQCGSIYSLISNNRVTDLHVFIYIESRVFVYF